MTLISDSDVVELDVPADPAYVAVVRTATAGLAARLDLTLDRIEDLRIAVDEACTLLIRGAEPATGHLTCTFRLDQGTLTVDITGPDAELPERGGYAWAVLSALVDALDCGQHHGDGGERSAWLRLTIRTSSESWS